MTRLPDWFPFWGGFSPGSQNGVEAKRPVIAGRAPRPRSLKKKMAVCFPVFLGSKRIGCATIRVVILETFLGGARKMGKMDFTQGSRGLRHRLTSIFRETENGYSEFKPVQKTGVSPASSGENGRRNHLWHLESYVTTNGIGLP